MDAQKSEKCDSCTLASDCSKRLICNSRQCIEPKSVPKGYDCTLPEACMNGLKCQSDKEPGKKMCL